MPILDMMTDSGMMDDMVQRDLRLIDTPQRPLGVVTKRWNQIPLNLTVIEGGRAAIEQEVQIRGG